MSSLDQKTISRLLEGFRQCITGQVVDAIEQLELPDATRCAAIGLQPLDRSLPTTAGIAVTMLEGPRRVGTKGVRLTKHGEVMRQMKPGEMLVISAGGLLSSCNWGGLLHLEAMRRGLAGVVVDGSVRDVELILRTRLPVYCKGTTPLSCHLIMETLTINQPIVCAGVHVRPGDFVVADADGVCFVPPECAEEVLKIALRKAEVEEKREAALWKTSVERLTEDVVNNPEYRL